MSRVASRYNKIKRHEQTTIIVAAVAATKQIAEAIKTSKVRIRPYLHFNL